MSRDFECEERDIRTISDCESNDGVSSDYEVRNLAVVKSAIHTISQE